MPEIEWFHPKTIDEALSHIRDDLAIPHAGGTGLLMGGLKRSALVDLRGLGLRYIKDKINSYEIGAMSTYTDCAKSLPRENILAIALGNAASTPLRNRITIGGSVAMAPMWSDSIGPLIALGARLKFAGEERLIAIEEYLRGSEHRKANIIEHIELPKTSGFGYYHRETRTSFDYPMFTLSGFTDGSSSSVVITGVKGKFSRLEHAEKALSGEITVEEAVNRIELEFPSKMQASADYLAQIAVVEIRRCLDKLVGGQR